MPSVTGTVIAAGVGAAGSIAGAGIQAGAANNAASDAAQAAAENDALEKQIYDSNKGELQPYINRGNAAGGAEAALLGLGGNAGAATKAFDNYLGSSGYNFQKNQGITAITGNRAASGVLDSGGTLKSLNAYGQGEASNYFQTYLSNLSGVAGSGLSGASALAGVGENYASQVSSNNNSAAGAAGTAGLVGAAGASSALAQGINAFGQYVGSSSFSNPSASAISAAQAAAGPVPF